MDSNRILLHFERWILKRVWVNEHRFGKHSGGYLPFSFDSTDSLKPGENFSRFVWDQLILAARAGKQLLKPFGIWYTAVSGIWQTVWLEPVAEISIDRLKITPDIDHSCVTIETFLRGKNANATLQVVALDGNQVVTSAEAKAGDAITLQISDAHLWSPEDPHLYSLKVSLISDGQRRDEVESYFAMRKFSIMKDDQGHNRMALNNKPIFMYGPLDQGYFPDGLYTPPTEEAMIYDIDYTKRLGCNFIRKHIKVEPLAGIITVTAWA
jgi:beta-galactosidase/beta-glucuronidase